MKKSLNGFMSSGKVRENGAGRTGRAGVMSEPR